MARRFAHFMGLRVAYRFPPFFRVFSSTPFDTVVEKLVITLWLETCAVEREITVSASLRFRTDERRSGEGTTKTIFVLFLGQSLSPLHPPPPPEQCWALNQLINIVRWGGGRVPNTFGKDCVEKARLLDMKKP